MPTDLTSPSTDQNDMTPPTPSLLPLVSLQLGLLLLAVFYTFVAGQTALGVFDAPCRTATLLIDALLLGGWLLWRWRQSHHLVVRAVELPVLGLWLAACLATIFSVDPFRSQEALLYLTTFFFFFALAVDLTRRRWLVELVLNALLGVAGLMWTLALWQLVQVYDARQAVPTLLRGLDLAPSLPRLSVLGNPNTMAAFLVPLAPLIGYKWHTAGRRFSRWLLIVWGLLTLAALLLTQSRGGLLGLAVALASYGWTLARPETTDRRRAGRWLLATVVALSLLAYGLMAAYGRGLSLDDGPTQVRLETMAGALKTLLAHPLAGSGPGTLGQELLRRQQPLREIHAHAHNLWLTFAAETGLPGILGLIWLAALVWRARGRPSDRLRLALQAALLGFLAHSLVDSFFDYPAVMLLAATLFGLWAGLAFPPRPFPPRWARLVNAIAAIVLLTVTAFGWQVTRGLAAYDRAVQASTLPDWAATAAYVQQAIAISPRSSFYARQLGLAYGHLAAQEPAYRPLALEQLTASLSVAGGPALDWANQSCLHWQSGHVDQAIEAMVMARLLEPDEALYALNLGHYLESQGRYQQAWPAYAEAIHLQPAYLRADFWQQTPARRENLSTVVALAAQRIAATAGSPSLRLAELYTQAGDLAAAWRTLEALEHGETLLDQLHIARAEVWLARGESDAALAELDAALAANPQAAWAYYDRAIIHLSRHRLTLAEQNIEAALYLAPEPAFRTLQGQIAQARGDPDVAIQHDQLAPAFYTRYAVEIARRPPLAQERLPCLILPGVADDPAPVAGPLQARLAPLCAQRLIACMAGEAAR
ncbi:MAG: O-antigen ligase family protein [Chloroflexota bacterium]